LKKKNELENKEPVKKVEYYLTHEEERRQIAENGYRKVKQYHTYRNRFDEMLKVMNLE